MQDALQRKTVKILMRLGKHGEAAEVYAAHQHPLDVVDHQGLALRLAHESGQGKAARRHAAKALELAPSEPTSHASAGFAAIAGRKGPITKDQETKALSAMRNAIKLRHEEGVQDSTFPAAWPVDMEAHVRHLLGTLVMSSFARGDTKSDAVKGALYAEARRHFEEANALAPDHAEYAESLTKIKGELDREARLERERRAASEVEPKAEEPVEEKEEQEVIDMDRDEL
eukprot:4946015-Prymnesium_polylepis.1